MSPPTPPPAPPATPRPPSNKPNPLLEVGITILVPALVLMQLSSAERLGPMPALLLALAFPIGWGVWDGLSRRKLNWLAVLGVVSTLLTGGIGLLKLDAQWLAVKEAAVPGLIGLAVLGSLWTSKPLIRLLVFNDNIFDVERVKAALLQRGNTVPFELKLRQGTLLLASTFFFSSVANYLLARWVVTSPAGSEAFNQELGRLTLLSYPVIALPSMAMMIGLMFWLARELKLLTGLDLGEMLRTG
jgi:hypothetical protein